MEIDNKISGDTKKYSRIYDYIYNIYYEFNFLERINNLNYLYKARIKMISEFLRFLNNLKTIIYFDNISCNDCVNNLKLYVPPGRLFSFFREITFLKKMSEYFNNIQIEIDKNIANLNVQQTLKIYGRHGFKKSINEIKIDLENLLKCMYPLLIDLKSYSDNKPIYRW